MIVLTLDQQHSRRRDDDVPRLLDLVAGVPLLRPFQRTAGDEVQAVADDPAAVLAVLARVVRAGGWTIGVGIGDVEHPLPRDARAGRGEAYLSAREAVTRAKSGPHRLGVVGADGYRAEQLETVLWLWSGILERRTTKGWEVADVLAAGVSHAEAGERLGITQSAVSQRAQAAGIVEERRARRLAVQLLSAMTGSEGGART